MTAAEHYRTVARRLAERLGPGEAEAVTRLLFEDIAGYDRKWLFVNGQREITDYMQAKIDAAVAKVLSGMPAQYAAGKARFMGLDFAVSPAVLIPRPETEGLVDAVEDLADGRPDLRVLDVCTGSGCIAIALARALPFSHVDAIDLSSEALEVARKNAAALKAQVNFFRMNALALPLPARGDYDFIVSNPPYVLESERADMAPAVVDYEPAMALFVPDSDPLRFYTAISRYAAGALRPGGWLCMEVNRRLAAEVVQTMESFGLTEAHSERDFRENPRYAFARRPAR